MGAGPFACIVLAVRRVFSILVVLLTWTNVVSAQQAVFLVRHAERADQSDDSPLSATGVQRAERLAALLKDAGITAIYTSEKRRTIDTGAPLAELLHIKSTALASTTALVDRLNRAQPTDCILVVGHSNTVPDVLAALGVTPKVTIADPEYDNLFLVFPRAGAAPGFLRLKY